MSDPCFVQISFKIKPNMPQDMRKLILLAFTDYYIKWFPNEKPVEDKCRGLIEKYPVISEFWRNDVYHNVGLQKCQLDENDWIIRNREKEPDRHHACIGVSVVTLPRLESQLDEFLSLVGEYIESEVSSIGYQHLRDYGTYACYYYFDSDGNIRRKLLTPSEDDSIVYQNKGGE